MPWTLKNDKDLKRYREKGRTYQERKRSMNTGNLDQRREPASVAHMYMLGRLSVKS